MLWIMMGLLAAFLFLFFLNWSARTDVTHLKKGAKITFSIIIISVSLLLIALIISGKIAFIPFLILTASVAFKILGSGLLDRYINFRRQPDSKKTDTIMTEEEALEILGLKKGASQADINQAYKKLMAQFHPDKGGTDWMAAKLNQARQTLSK